MNKTEVSSSDASKALESMKDSQQAMLSQFKIPVWISALASLSYGAIIFGYGMTEHENKWALAMWLGGFFFVVFMALYVFCYRIAGIKVSLWPRSKESTKLNLYTGLVFALLVIASRLLRVGIGLDYAPHVCAGLSAVLLFWLQRKYPTGEVEDKRV